MKESLIIFVALIVAASCQIYTKIQADGYHYDRPQEQLKIPETKAYLPPFEDLKVVWDSWKSDFSKLYDNLTEENNRRSIFYENIRQIDLHNRDFSAGLVTFNMSKNKFCDLTPQEFVKFYTGLNFEQSGLKNTYEQDTSNIFKSPLSARIEDEFDWRKKGAISPVKNQGQCGSCWAFSANGALEAHNFIKKGTGPISLSEQNLVDCVKGGSSNGCKGGLMTEVYDYVKNNNGVDTEASYPYETRDDTTCRFRPENVGGECKGYMKIEKGNEEAIRQAVATVGPVSIGIDASLKSFQYYKNGLYYDANCKEAINHAVLIVGYGKTDRGEEYWIVKNSWGTEWGEGGYAKMARNKNLCGISNFAQFPIV